MAAKSTGIVLRAAVQALGERRAGLRYPNEIRARVAEYVRQRRGDGEQLKVIAAELGMRRQLLRRWSESEPAPGASAFLPVSVVGDTPDGFVLHGPRGIRVEGLDIDALAALLVRLG